METEKEAQELEEPPGCSHTQPPHPWEAIPITSWRDWRWQLAHRLSGVEELGKVVRLTSEEVEGLSDPGRFRVEVTPYFASLMDPDDPACPIRRQVIPTHDELVPYNAEMADSLAEDSHSPVPGLVHRYPDRVLMLVTTQCASYCRYCTRSRLVGNPAAQFRRKTYDTQIEYIARTPQIRDVLLSGGDPLTLPQSVLENILRRLRAIEHVEVVRIGTRVPIFLPMRITPELTGMLRKYHPLWINVHTNHPKEITPEVRQALAQLADAGIPLGNQSVLLAGVNDCPNVMKDLVHALVKNRVRPYYIYQCDMVQGAGHFRTPVSVGTEIIESLRGHTSGFAVPTFVIDAPHGGGKIPVMPNYLLSQSLDHVVVRNYQGFITAYAQPDTYDRHDPSRCPSCLRGLPSGKQESQSVAALLSGKQPAIRLVEEVGTRPAARATMLEAKMVVPSGTNGHSR